MATSHQHIRVVYRGGGGVHWDPPEFHNNNIIMYIHMYMYVYSTNNMITYIHEQKDIIDFVITALFYDNIFTSIRMAMAVVHIHVQSKSAVRSPPPPPMSRGHQENDYYT